MSEFEKVIGMKKLAIFPLPLVLMPFELLPLHIFEPRYRQLLEDIQHSKNMFGVSYIDPGAGVAAKPDLGSLGCVAEVREAQNVGDGRSNIITMGVIRYRIEEYLETAEPYLMAKVDFFEDYEPSDEVEPAADDVFELFKEITQVAHKMNDIPGELPEIERAKPEPLSFLVGAAFNLDSEIKYKMIKTRSTKKRLLRLKEVLTKALVEVKETAKINKISRKNGHTKKDLNLDGI